MQDLTMSATHLVSGILRHLTPADMGTLRADFLQRVANRARQPLRQKQPHPGVRGHSVGWFHMRDRSLSTGRGGLQNGNIVGPKLFAPPLKAG